ncbi:TetR/AcrR family transcriptional regulator [Nocardioides sp. GY 10127]|uniref:TetR/AcrR family transcriptional regulator n=1 Tax=Nocardioides sp. GY 10127 TaxID=2569762 RepID=UPI0010A939E2|nr:TetR/AcrR family transcriptional regulator [Nocardioides sp. GY 10127]TIC85533.1 TetR/AcrR family transcriptional regulator [Nocardioides sp. GY 10127]
MTDQTTGSRPGGRSSRVREAVHAAVGELLAEGAERITFPVVAERAGVNPTTLYRRWSDVDALLEEVTVAALTRDGENLPDGGSLSEDLATWAETIRRDISRPARSRYLRAMVGARDGLADSCPVTDLRAEQAGRLLAAAAGRGEPVPTVEQVLDHVVSPLYYRIVFGLDVDAAHARRLTDDVLRMAT